MNRRDFLSASVAALVTHAALAESATFSIRDFGATGSGVALDTAAIQRTIDAASEAGGGVVDIPAGRYLSFTIHLRSHIALRFAPGAVLIAATPDLKNPVNQYDLTEPQPESIRTYQDFGHNHWHNSLLWGEDLQNVSLTGPGEIWGRGLNKGDGPNEEKPGAGNKAIALKRCRNVLLRDLSLREVGHFGILATAVDSLTIDNLRIDTRRDGIDIDSCRDVHIRGCNVNAPWDDAIVLKSSYSLGELRSTERVTISDCIVTGRYQAGTMLDATYKPFPPKVPVDQPSFIGRIKIGTETNGDIRDVVVTNCVLEGCHGVAVTCEDGGTVEDISFANITMRDMVGPPIFVRLGGRLRGPSGTKLGKIRRVSFNQIDCTSASGLASSIIAGIPGAPVEDVSVRGLRVLYPGGAAQRTGTVPEEVAGYPDPEIFGITPSQGFYVRHGEGIDLRDIRLTPARPDARPLIWLDDVQEIQVTNVTGPKNVEPLHTVTDTLP